MPTKRCQQKRNRSTKILQTRTGTGMRVGNGQEGDKKVTHENARGEIGGSDERRLDRRTEDSINKMFVPTDEQGWSPLPQPDTDRHATQPLMGHLRSTSNILVTTAALYPRSPLVRDVSGESNAATQHGAQGILLTPQHASLRMILSLHPSCPPDHPLPPLGRPLQLFPATNIVKPVSAPHHCRCHLLHISKHSDLSFTTWGFSYKCRPLCD